MARPESRRKPSAASGPVPAPALAPKPTDAARHAMQKPARSWRWMLVVLVLALGAGLVWRHQSGLRAEARIAQEAADTGPVGGVTGCRQLPAWLPIRGRSPQATLSTSDRRLQGLVLVDPQAGKYRHPSWDDAGWLGPILIDGRGDVLVAPVPVINLIDNRPEQQNTLWRVDAVSEVMLPLLDLPAAAPPSPRNPYGLLGLAHDCETGSVYASSVAGSDHRFERGRIFQIDPAVPAVKSVRDGIDAIGLVVFRGTGGKRLYFGSARRPEVWSLPLSRDGAIGAEARLEFSLEDRGPRGDDRARRIRIEADGSMLVHGIEFSFNLVAPTEKQETTYRLRYDHGADRWRLREIGNYEVTD